MLDAPAPLRQTAAPDAPRTIPSLTDSEQTADAPRRFVILAEARSGSGWLASLLKSHPACDCFDELFHPEGVQGGRRVSEAGVSVRERDADPPGFLDRLFETALAVPGVTHVGYKHIIGVAPEVLRRLLRERGLRVLLLIRRDRLAQYASLLTARRTGIWAQFPHFEPPPPPALRFEARGFLDFCRARDAELAAARRLLADCRAPVHETTYEALAAGESLEPLLAHLGLKTQVALQSRYIRQDERPAAERFENAGRARRLGRLIAWRPTRRLVRLLRGIRPLRKLLE